MRRPGRTRSRAPNRSTSGSNKAWSRSAAMPMMRPGPAIASRATPAKDAQPPGLGGPTVDHVDGEVSHHGHPADEPVAPSAPPRSPCGHLGPWREMLSGIVSRRRLHRHTGRLYGVTTWMRRRPGRARRAALPAALQIDRMRSRRRRAGRGAAPPRSGRPAAAAGCRRRGRARRTLAGAADLLEGGERGGVAAADRVHRVDGGLGARARSSTRPRDRGVEPVGVVTSRWPGPSRAASHGSRSRAPPRRGTTAAQRDQHVDRGGAATG